MKRVYNLNWRNDHDQLAIELYCFKVGHPPEKGGLGKFGHLKKCIELIWPKTTFCDWRNDWLTWGLSKLCQYKTNAWTGCGAAGKTFTATLFGTVFWMADPHHTAVVLVSTTSKMIRKRAWPVIQELYNSTEMIPGNLVDSHTTLQADQGDDKHGIFAMAVKQGPINQAVANLVGVHCPRMLVILDEATDIPEAIMHAIVNLQKGCQEFLLVSLGNAEKHLDPHGRLCEPADGWASVDVDDVEWPSKGVPEWDVEPGIALHFDGTKSPNVKAGKDNWPFLFTNKDLAKALNKPDADKHLGYWKYTRGFWVPDGFTNTVMSEGLIEKHDGRGKFMFLNRVRKIAGLDPGFGGDACVLRLGRKGNIEGGREAVQLDQTIHIPLRVQMDKKEEVYDQIVSAVLPILRTESVDPEAFGLDATGKGGVLAAKFVAAWSDRIQMVEFGGIPNTDPVSDEDPRPANEVYDRQVTALHFFCRELLIHEQLKGLEPEEIKQFCGREFCEKARKIRLDTKDEAKQKTLGHSPDEADSTVVLCEVARRLGLSAGGGTPTSAKTNWLDMAKEKDAINEEYVPDDENKSEQPATFEDRFALSEL